MNSEQKQKEIQKVYTAYYYLLFNLAMRKLGNMQQAEDICQEVFIHYSEKHKEVKNAKSWLVGALRMEILDFFKSKNAKQSNTNDLNEYAEILESAPNTDLEIKIILNDILEKEDDLHRQIFELKNIYKWTLTAIAKEFDMTRPQVRYIYEQVSKKLLLALKKKGISSLGDIL